MIGRALIGGVAAAVAMFIIGFIFFATPLYKLGTGSLDNGQAAAVLHADIENEQVRLISLKACDRLAD